MDNRNMYWSQIDTIHPHLMPSDKCNIHSPHHIHNEHMIHNYSSRYTTPSWEQV